MLEMTESWIEGSKHASVPESVSCSVSRCQTSSPRRLRQRNIFHLLAQREVSPRTKHQAKKLWTKLPKCDAGSIELRFWATDARHDLFSWAESQSLHRWSAKYCPILPAPRSTIAAAFSTDGRTLASTHGDHTVKIIDCQTGKCLNVLSGHRRTPWVVRYHPLYSDTVASGSLDHEVCLWDAKTSHCIGSHYFYRPIASIAFHAKGELLAVASGHKLFIWDYNKRGEASDPPMILRTRRSLRAVQFHPHGAPYLLTAEVNNLDSADSDLTLATSSGYSNCNSAVFFANINSTCCRCPHLESKLSLPCFIWHAYPRDDGSICLLRNDWASGSTNVQQRLSSLDRNLLASDAENEQAGLLVTPMDVCPGEPGVTSDDNTISASSSTGIETNTIRGQSYLSSSNRNPEMTVHARPDVPSGMPMDSFTASSGLDALVFLRHAEAGHHHHNCIGGSRISELPFFQGWLMAQSHAGLRPALLNNDTLRDLPLGGSAEADYLTSELPYMYNFEHVGASSSVPITNGSLGGPSRQYTSQRHLMASVPGVGSSLLGTQIGEAGVHAVSLGIGSEVTTSLHAPGAAELPCTVKLKIWRHNIKDPCVTLEPEACRLTISHAVLCSEMGTHFSPCGRFLVACVACLLPQTEGDYGSQLPVQYDSTGAGTSPTRHPLPSHRVIFELRVYSLEEATFGTVLVSRAIRAAHCLTSIQFSPTSEHILLAYGRRHNSLLRSIVMDGETTIPVYTVLEVYRVSDMELVRVLPSAEDEVNVACFHPSPGAGLVYGTKEGKLRILQHDGADAASMGLNFFIGRNLREESVEGDMPGRE